MTSNNFEVPNMAKGLTIMAMVVALLVLLIFAMDLILGFPFMRTNKLMDMAFVICGAILAYLGWSAFNELK